MVTSNPPKRFDVYLVTLDPTKGREIKKTRPCVIISPDEMNHHLETHIVAPMTTKGFTYPTRIPIKFDGKQGLVVLDQMRTVDRSRLVKHMGRLHSSYQSKVIDTLVELFS